MPAAPLRKRVTVSLDPAAQRWLDEEFGPYMQSAHDAMDGPDTIRALHGQLYWLAAEERRQPLDEPNLTDRTLGQLAGMLAGICAAIVVGIFGIDDVIPYLVEAIR